MAGKLAQARRSFAAVLMVAVGMVIPLVIALRLALVGQLSKLHPPTQPRAEFSDLWGAGPDCALATWRSGGTDLHVFHPASVELIVRTIVATQFVAVVLLAIVGVILTRGARWRPLLLASTAGLVTVAAARSYAELSLLASDHPDDRYSALFTWSGWAGLVFAVAVALGAVLNNLDALGTGMDTFLRSPAAARITAAAALGFAALLQAGDIGAQCEDILRREASSPYFLPRLGGSLGLYILVLVLVRRLKSDTGVASKPGQLAIAGVVIVIIGFGVGTGFGIGNFDGLRPEGTWSALVFLGGLIGLAGLLSIGSSTEATDSQNSKRRFALKALTAISFFATLVALVLTAIGMTWLPWWAVWVSAALFLAAATVRYQMGRDHPSIPPPEDHGRWLFAFAGAAVPLGLAMLACRVLAGEVATGGKAWWYIARIVGLVIVAVLAGRQLVPEPTIAADADRATKWMVAIVAGLGLAIAVATLSVSPGFPDKVGSLLGSIGVLIVTLAVTVAWCGVVRILTDNQKPLLVFRRLGFFRTPALTLLIAWIVLTLTLGGHLDGGGRGAHDQRLATGDLIATSTPFAAEACTDPVLRERFNLKDPNTNPVAGALCTWLTRVAKGKPGPVPLALVGASGGGVRAATWTERVLECVFPADPEPGQAIVHETACHVPDGTDSTTWSNVFALNGASGGSVGIVSTTAQRLFPVASTNDKNWIRALAQDDHVATAFAHMVFGDTMLSPFGLAPDQDRGSALIDRWSRPFANAQTNTNPSQLPGDCGRLANRNRDLADLGFLAVRRICPELVPLLLLNGTAVRDGSRVDISPLQLRTGAAESPDADPLRETRSLDLADILCKGQDLPLFDAAFLSARFPLVTPSAHFPAGGSDATGCEGKPAVEVVDGGYAENSGNAQLGELWQELGPLLKMYNDKPPAGYPPVKVVYVEIDNGANGPARGCTPAERQDLGGPLSSADITDRSSAAGEPLRVLLAKQQVTKHAGAADFTARCSVVTLLESEGVVTARLSLFEHPGRRLPLGWSLTSGVVDDIDRTYCLAANQAEVHRVWAAGLGGDQRPAPSTCPEVQP